MKVEVRAVNVADLSDATYHQEIPQTAVNETNFDPNLYEPPNKLRCEGRNKQADAALIKKYHNSSQYKLYPSEWYTSFSHNCLENGPILVSQAFIALLIVISGIGAMIAIYTGRTFYKKVTDFGLIFPPGLEHLRKHPFAAPDEDTRSTTEQFTAHNKGVNCFVQLPQDNISYNNERHHLLPLINSDFSFSEHSANRVVDDYAKSTPIPEDYKRSISQSSSDSNAGSSTSTMAAESPPSSTNYISASNLKNSPIAPTSNYVTVDNLPPTGYINPAQLQKTQIPLSVMAGYTTAEQLAKMNVGNEAAESVYLDGAKETGISGYVTPGDLNVFSKQQNRQAFDENRC